MVVNKAAKIKIGLVVFSLIIISFFIHKMIYKTSDKTIEVLYFTNPKCQVSSTTEILIKEIQEEFGENVYVKKFFVSMYPDDPEDTEEVKKLKEDYKIYGIPVMIINGKEFKKEFTLKNLKREICRNFSINPKVCLVSLFPFDLLQNRV